jgi:hypothetical protein
MKISSSHNSKELNSGESFATRRSLVSACCALLLCLLSTAQAARGQAASTADIDVEALLREVQQHQAENRQHLTAEYVYRDKDTQRTFNERGEMTKELVQVFELYVLPQRRFVVRKLISLNNVPLSPERAAEEEKRIAERLAKAEKQPEQPSSGHSIALTLRDYLRACEFISPRRERLHDRAVIVLDFHPRPGFVPTINEEKIAATLTGTIWIDAADKMLMRLDARSPELKEKNAATRRPGAYLLHENIRLPEGVWVPSYSQLILLNKAYPFLGRDIHTTHEYSDYKRFSTNVQDAKTDEPK